MSQSPQLLKFRPVFTLSQIRRILSNLPVNPTMDAELDQSIRRVLIPLLAKIEVGAINPAYKLSETHAAKIEQSNQRKRYEEGQMSPEEEEEYVSKVLGV